MYHYRHHHDKCARHPQPPASSRHAPRPRPRPPQVRKTTKRYHGQHDTAQQRSLSFGRGGTTGWITGWWNSSSGEAEAGPPERSCTDPMVRTEVDASDGEGVEPSPITSTGYCDTQHSTWHPTRLSQHTIAEMTAHAQHKASHDHKPVRCTAVSSPQKPPENFLRPDPRLATPNQINKHRPGSKRCSRRRRGRWPWSIG